MTRRKKPTRGADNPLKYTQLTLWLSRQGYSTAEMRTMRLSRAVALMDADRAARDGGEKRKPGVRDATEADYHLLF